MTNIKMIEFFSSVNFLLNINTLFHQTFSEDVDNYGFELAKPLVEEYKRYWRVEGKHFF